ncbi:MAG: hypothetical protein HY736_23965 [Verrucomicrobia bacterium]|nr:hypothetical protein [Verrucomicrobiota bacterium]
MPSVDTNNAPMRPRASSVWQVLHDHAGKLPGLPPEATAGVFDADGTFHLAPTGGWEELQELWRHALLRRIAVVETTADIDAVLAPLGLGLPRRPSAMRATAAVSTTT